MPPRVFGRLQRIDHPWPTGFRYSRYLVLGLFLNFIGSSLISSANPVSAAAVAESSPAARQMEQGLNSFQRGDFEQAVVELDRSCPIV